MENYYLLIALISVIISICLYYYYKNGKSFSILEKIPGTKKYKERKQREKEEFERHQQELQMVREGLTGVEAQLHERLDNTYLNHSVYVPLRASIQKIDNKYGQYVAELAGEFPMFYGLLDNDSFPEDHNTKFLLKEEIRLKDEFGKLTPSQQEAVFSDEDAIIVNAGAGTGKTKTIENKIKYLYKEKKIPLRDILVVTYSKKSQEDMMNRICNTLESERIPFKKDELRETISTFHAFGKKILDECECRKHSNQNVIGEGRATKRVIEDEERYKIINKSLSTIKDDPEILDKIIHYFLYYDKQIVTEPIQEDEGRQRKYRPNEYPSFLKSEGTNVVVKSYGELLIANYLVEHGINVQYEGKDFHYTDKKGNQRDYKPDFYLPDYKIFIEYFGVDENEKTAPWIDEEGYVESMKDKIEEHKKAGNILIDMRYADLKLGRESFLSKFEKELKKNNVNTSGLAKVDQTIIREQMTNLGRVLSSFLALYCECRLSDDIIYQRIQNLPVREKERADRFYEIFRSYYKTYRSLLDKDNIMDFSEMILGAIKCLHSGQVKRSFKYILVDEFQDISKARADLLLELIKDHNQTKLFCVGDDWQSIYKFTGSELGIFLDFDKYFGYAKHITLYDTFRFNQGISDVSGAFIQRNPTQIKKTLHSLDQETKDRVIVVEKLKKDGEQAYRNVIKDMLDDRIAHFSEDDKSRYKLENCEISCLYLTRYSLIKYQNDIFDILDKNKNVEEDSDGFKIYTFPYKDYNFVLSVKPLTVHGSKGLEADYVIVDHVNGRHSYTFPSNIDDDPVLDLCMVDDKFAYPFAEERRLFYVAITRGKHKAYVLHDRYSGSSFTRDIRTLLGGGELSKNVKGPHCAKCGGDLFIVNSMTNEYACKNGCDVKYFAYDGALYKAPVCNCGQAYSVLRISSKTGEPFWSCSTFPKCWKFHKFKKEKYRIGFIKN